MKNELTKLKAFTLSEMIVALLITTIVVGMAYSVLNLVQKQMYGIETNYQKNTKLNVLKQSFWIDFSSCDRAFFNANSRELSFENELKTTLYVINENSIVKEKDTFAIDWEYQKFYFENKEQLDGEIDAIDFRTDTEFGNQQLFVYKNNSARSYMSN